MGDCMSAPQTTDSGVMVARADARKMIFIARLSEEAASEGMTQAYRDIFRVTRRRQ